MTVEYYWLDDHGHFHRIAMAKYSRLVDGTDTIPQLAGRTVPIAEVILDVEDRRVRDVRRVILWRHAFKRDGRLDLKHWGGRHGLTLDATEELFIGRHEKVRYLSPRISARRVEHEFRYRPTHDELQALMDAVWGRSRVR